MLDLGVCKFPMCLYFVFFSYSLIQHIYYLFSQYCHDRNMETVCE